MQRQFGFLVSFVDETHTQLLTNVDLLQYLAFKPNYWWWGICVSNTRRLLLTMIVSLLPNKSSTTPVLVFIVLFFAICVQVWKRPYRYACS